MFKEPLPPSSRFTGIFIPTEILELEELTLFEMLLLSFIDALYCPKHRGCYASNEYLAKKMRNAKENTVAKALTKLRNLKLIEDVSFDGRKRVIRSLVNRYIDKCQSNPALDKNPTGENSIGFLSNPEMDIYPSSPYIENKVDIKEKKKTKKASDDAIALSFYFFEKIKENKNDFKKPDLDTWSKEMELMLSLDKRNPEKVKKIIDWVLKHSFWKKNILCPKNLRKQFDRLEIQMQEENIPASNLDLTERLKKNKLFAEAAERQLSHLFNSYVSFTAGSLEAALFHFNKQINKIYKYEEFSPEDLKEKLIKDLEICFPGAKKLLLGNAKNNQINNLINSSAKAMKL